MEKCETFLLQAESGELGKELKSVVLNFTRDADPNVRKDLKFIIKEAMEHVQKKSG